MLYQLTIIGMETCLPPSLQLREVETRFEGVDSGTPGSRGLFLPPWIGRGRSLSGCVIATGCHLGGVPGREGCWRYWVELVGVGRGGGWQHAVDGQVSRGLGAPKSLHVGYFFGIGHPCLLSAGVTENKRGEELGREFGWDLCPK